MKDLQKQFTRNIILLLAINLLVKPIYVLCIDAQVYNQVGDATYGVYFALFNFCFLLQIILDLGIQNYNSKVVSQNRAGVADHFSYVLGTRLVLILLFLFLVTTIAYIVGYPSTYYPVLCGIALIMVLQVTYVYLRSHFSALGRFSTESWLSALDKLLMIIVIGYFIYISKTISIANFIYGQITGLVIAILVALLLLGNQFRLSVRFSKARSLELIKNSYPFAIVFILMAFYTRMDGVMLERLLDDDGVAAGIYSSGFRLLDAANIIGYLFSVLLLPMYAKKLGDNEAVLPLVKTATGLLLVMSSIVTVVCYYFANDIIALIYPQSGTDNVEIFRILMVGFWFMSMSYVYGALITANGQLRKLNMIFMVGIVINLSLNLWLIPIYSGWGAAIATLVTQSGVFIAQFLLACKKFKLTFSMSYMFRIFIYMLIAIAFTKIVSEKLDFFWFFEVMIVSSLLIGISFFMGFIRFNSLFEDQ